MTEDELVRIISLYNNTGLTLRCFYCGIRTCKRKPKQASSKNGGPHPQRMRTRDHVIPKCIGGYLTVTACFACNGAKGDLDLEEFRILRHSGKAVDFFFEYELRRLGLWENRSGGV